MLFSIYKVFFSEIFTFQVQLIRKQHVLTAIDFIDIKNFSR